MDKDLIIESLPIIMDRKPIHNKGVISFSVPVHLAVEFKKVDIISGMLLRHTNAAAVMRSNVML